jgi:hypothetical protein
MLTSTVDFIERHWVGMTLAIPIAVYAAWIASLVVPEIVKAVVPEVVRAVTGS